MENLNSFNVEILTKKENLTIFGGSEFSEAFAYLVGGIAGWIANTGRYIQERNGEGNYKY